MSNITCLRHKQITPISTETRMTYCVHRKISVIGNSESQLAILLAKNEFIGFLRVKPGGSIIVVN